MNNAILEVLSPLTQFIIKRSEEEGIIEDNEGKNETS